MCPQYQQPYFATPLQILLTLLGNLFSERGTILTAFIIMYALTSVVGGFVSGSFYARNGGRRWVNVFLLTALLFPGVRSGSKKRLPVGMLCKLPLRRAPRAG